jgi:putative restriction endonuclease
MPGECSVGSPIYEARHADLSISRIGYTPVSIVTAFQMPLNCTMRYWWVNQNQTFRQEVAGGYIWSPKRNANGARNPFYEFMREVAPGDLILSFQGTYIRKIGIARSNCYECPKPAEFGAAGPSWDLIGWKVDIRYIDPVAEIRPADHMDSLRPHLPAKYSPLLADGRGLQSIYLTVIPEPLMNALAILIGPTLRGLTNNSTIAEAPGETGAGLLQWERHLEVEVETDSSITDTSREQIILARRGQGRFKENVRHLEAKCRITHVDRLEHLRASHIRPWRSSGNDERLDGENGLLLTPTIDHLFDRGFISFEDDGRLLVSPAAHKPSVLRMGVPTDGSMNVGRFSEGQRRYLDFHREFVFLEARKSRQ